MSEAIPVAFEAHRVLFIRFGGLGDILMTTPTLRALKSRFPDARIDYLVGRGFREVLDGHPSVARVTEFDKRGGDMLPHRLVRFLLALRREKYDLIINLQPSFKTKWMTHLAHPRHCLTFHKDQLIQAATSRRRHAIDDFRRVLDPLLGSREETHEMDFVVPRAAQERIDALLNECDVDREDRLVIVHPSANHRVNRWPLDHFASLCMSIGKKSRCRIALTGSRRDCGLVKALKKSLGASDNAIDLCGRLSIKEFGALLMRADAFVTGDTGPMHMASALNTPTISLFGAADPDRTGPRSRRADVLRVNTLPCVPCHCRKCRFGRQAACMSELRPETVLAAVERTLGFGLATGTLAGAGERG